MTLLSRDKLYLSYTGPSMSPTLKPGDVLTVEPCCPDLRRGDVIVFRDADSRNIVHRVVSNGQAGVKARGDNNLYCDAGIIEYNRIVGRVVAARRGNITIPITGGFWALKAVKRVQWFFIDLLHPFYLWLSKLLQPKKMFKILLRPRYLYFTRPEGLEIQVLIGKKVVARYLPAEKLWHIRRPYKLIFDKKTLPSSIPTSFQGEKFL